MLKNCGHARQETEGYNSIGQRSSIAVLHVWTVGDCDDSHVVRSPVWGQALLVAHVEQPQTSWIMPSATST